MPCPWLVFGFVYSITRLVENFVSRDRFFGLEVRRFAEGTRPGPWRSENRSFRQTNFPLSDNPGTPRCLQAVGS
jgi:hypothetical protein